MADQNAGAVSKRWRYLAGGSVGMLFIGIIFAWSIMKAPLGEEMGWSADELAAAYTLSLCFFCVGNLLTGLLLKKAGFRKMLLISGALIVSGFGGAAAIYGESAVPLYFSYGVTVGCGIGLAYNTLLSTANSWFPDRKGVSSGILMMSFGLSTMMWGKIGPWLFKAPGFGWRKAYGLIGLLIAAVVLLCAAVLRAPDASLRLPPRKGRGGGEENPAPKDYRGSEVIRRPSFWLYYIYGIFAASVGSTVFSFAMDLSLFLGASLTLATTMVGVMSVGNGLGRILCGACFDAFGMRITIFLANCVTLLAPATMLGAIYLRSIPAAAMSLLLSGLSFGTCPTIGSALMGSFYGMKYFPMNYSLSNSKMIFSSVGASIASALLGSSGGYAAPYLMLLGLALLAFCLSFFIRKP